MIEVKELTNNSFEISWDKNDPLESIMNTWKEDDFLDAIEKYLNKLKND